MSDPIAEAKAEILRLHNAWFEANAGLQGHKLASIFAGERFFDYNLNGYRYNGISDMEKLWSPNFMPSAFDLRSLKNVRNFQIEATAEMGWVTCEADCELAMRKQGMGEMKGDNEVVVMPFRITEVYRKDDGNGNPVWRMWHFHCSQELPDNSRRFETQ